ncbi:MAG: ammonium transporter [Actinobacteria bacterium]|nr:ammonium transporter [Actinomycetota bacterium]
MMVLSTGVSQARALPSDPGGVVTGNASDISADDPANPTMSELSDTVGHTKVSLNFVWMLIAGFLVMFMQVGFAMVETGFTRAKNANHTMLMNFLIYSIGIIGFWAIGFALMYGGVGPLGTLGGNDVLRNELTLNIFGKSFGIIGYKGFFLSGVTYDVAIFAFFLFQMVFMDTAATIPTGAMAERWKFSAFMIYGFFVSVILYPLIGNWVWGGGWLSQLGRNFGFGNGAVDFAGSGVVHMVGGICGLAGAKIIGARMGKYNQNGTANAIPGHNIPMAIIGTLILVFGWFGFNSGSTLAGYDLRISVVATNTMLASAAGAFVAVIYMWIRYKKPDPSMAANGMLAGLVGITAPAAFVNAVSAIVIGGVAGLIVCASVFFIERRLKVDDPVGAVSVHGVVGAWGLISVGLFADGTYGAGLNGVDAAVRGLFYGNPSQLYAQIIDVAVIFLVVYGLSYGFFKLVDVTVGMRVSPKVEVQGLDLPEVGALAYPRDSI